MNVNLCKCNQSYLIIIDYQSLLTIATQHLPLLALLLTTNSTKIAPPQPSPARTPKPPTPTRPPPPPSPISTATAKTKLADQIFSNYYPAQVSIAINTFIIITWWLTTKYYSNHLNSYSPSLISLSIIITMINNPSHGPWNSRLIYYKWTMVTMKNRRLTSYKNYMKSPSHHELTESPSTCHPPSIKVWLHHPSLPDPTTSTARIRKSEVRGLHGPPSPPRSAQPRGPWPLSSIGADHDAPPMGSQQDWCGSPCWFEFGFDHEYWLITTKKGDISTNDLFGPWKPGRHPFL